MPQQPHQWGQGAQQGNPPCGESGGHGVAHRRDHATPEPHLFGSTIPPLANQTRSTEGDHRMAHKLARLVYRMLKYGQEYIDKGMQYYEERNRIQQLEQLKKKAAKLGLQLVEVQPA